MKAKTVHVDAQGRAHYGTTEIEPRGDFFKNHGMAIGNPIPGNDVERFGHIDIKKVSNFINDKGLLELINTRGAMRSRYTSLRTAETTRPDMKQISINLLRDEMASIKVLFVFNPLIAPKREDFHDAKLFKQAVRKQTIRITLSKATDHQHIIFRPGHGVAFSLYAEALISRKVLIELGLKFEKFDSANPKHVESVKVKEIFTDMSEISESEIEEDMEDLERIFSHSFVDIKGIKTTALESGLLVPDEGSTTEAPPENKVSELPEGI